MENPVLEQLEGQVHDPSETAHILPDDIHRCYELIRAANHKLQQELEIADSRGREDYDKDLGRWKIDAQKLGDSELQPRKFAFIGRTGVGKSTAINAILGAPVLSTAADGACTSVQTEVIYENLPPSEWRVSVQFIEEHDWETTLSNMLDDLEVYRNKGPSNHGRGTHDDSGPAMEAWETLKQESPSYFLVYPHLRTLSFPPPEQDIHTLLEHEAVASKLGTEISICGVGFDKLELQESCNWKSQFNSYLNHAQLRPYLTSYSNIAAGGPPESSVWHLVDRVRIYGAFEVLASRAVALVDVPGFGDANKTRTNRTEEYLKTAEVVVLVADIKRAVDDQTMRDYLKKFLRTMIRVDGSMESLLIVLTGADVPINEDQLHHLDVKQRSVIQEMCQQAIDRLSDSLKELEDSSKKLSAPTYNNFKEHMEHQQRRNEITSKLQTKQADKSTYIAHQRAARVREVFLHLYRQVYHNISNQDNAKEPPPLPVFCVGSTDFNQLLGVGGRNKAPSVFTNPEDTGIPQLCRHIHDFGRKRALSDIKAHIDQCTLLRAEVNSFFKLLSARNDSMSTTHQKAARIALKKFKRVVEDTCEDSGGKIDDSINELENALRDEAENAADCSLDIITSLGVYPYQTYRAAMRREGEWQRIDLNEDLVRDMLEGSVSRIWHELFNDSWKSELELLIYSILGHYRAAIGSIKDGEKQNAKPKIATRVQDAIKAEDILDTAKQRYLFAISKMQREFGGSFKGFIRNELKAHYDLVGSERGKGMLQRMKDMNEEYFRADNAQKLYSGLVDDVMLAIRSAKNAGDRALEETIPRLCAHIERRFVFIQKSDKMSKDTRKKMLTFLDEQYIKSLAEVTLITDRYEERDTTPME